jgi:hypothetical protein
MRKFGFMGSVFVEFIPGSTGAIIGIDKNLLLPEPTKRRYDLYAGFSCNQPIGTPYDWEQLGFKYQDTAFCQ